MKEFHFSFGNSSEGPIGMCAVVSLSNDAKKEEALKELKKGLEDNEEFTIIDREGRVIYANVYINVDAIKMSHIDEVRTVEDEEPEA